MRKLVILSAVAALAAFGWVSNVDANDIAGDLTGAGCTLNPDEDGTVDDVYNISIPDIGQARTSVKLMCGNGRHEASAMTDGAGVSIPVPNMNGWKSLDTNDGCMFWMTTLHDPGTPNGGNEKHNDDCPNINASE